MRRLYYWAKDYLDTAHEIETISNPEHGPLLTPSLDDKLMMLQGAVWLLGSVTAYVAAVALGADNTPYSAHYQIVDFLGFLHKGELTVSDAVFVALPFSFLAMGAGSFARAFVVHRIFATEWKNRSFHIPVVRAFF